MKSLSWLLSCKMSSLCSSSVVAWQRWLITTYFNAPLTFSCASTGDNTVCLSIYLERHKCSSSHVEWQRCKHKSRLGCAINILFYIHRGYKRPFHVGLFLNLCNPPDVHAHSSSYYVYNLFSFLQ